MPNPSNATKSRTFAFLVYPESAPSDWRQTLRDARLKFCIPVDAAMHTPDDEISKPHFHVMFYNNSPITAEGAARKIPAEIPANGYVEPVGDHNAYCRYMLHLDDPDKQQFEGDPSELLECVRGFPLDLTRHLTSSEETAIEDATVDYIRENNVTNYAALLFSLKDAAHVEMYEYAKHHAYMCDKLIASFRYLIQDGYQVPSDDQQAEGQGVHDGE